MEKVDFGLIRGEGELVYSVAQFCRDAKQVAWGCCSDLESVGITD